LKKVVPLDLAHLPQEIALIETLGREFSTVPQIACFDTAFFAICRASRNSYPSRADTIKPASGDLVFTGSHTPISWKSCAA